MFYSLCKLATFGLLLPMSIVDCECGFSALARIKTDIRNRLSSKILNNLITITIEGLLPEDFPYDKACDIWAAWRNRRIDINALVLLMSCIKNELYLLLLYYLIKSYGTHMKFQIHS